MADILFRSYSQGLSVIKHFLAKTFMLVTGKPSWLGELCRRGSIIIQNSSWVMSDFQSCTKRRGHRIWQEKFQYLRGTMLDAGKTKHEIKRTIKIVSKLQRTRDLTSREALIPWKQNTKRWQNWTWNKENRNSSKNSTKKQTRKIFNMKLLVEYIGSCFKTEIHETKFCETYCSLRHNNSIRFDIATTTTTIYNEPLLTITHFLCT